jgi:hypothetical protein
VSARGSPVLHGSPHKHNPYLSVAQSELPPTAQRSPDLKPQLSLSLTLSPSPDPAHAPPHPSSPPRDLTVLDLAEESDAAADAEAEGRPYTPSALTRSPSFASSGMGVMMGPHSSLSLDAHPSPSSNGLAVSSLSPSGPGSLPPLHSPRPSALVGGGGGGGIGGGATLLGALTAINASTSAAEQLQSPTKRRKVDA